MSILFTGGDKPLGGWSLEEYDAIEQLVADGALCPIDGQPHDWVDTYEDYGADADGNRGVRIRFQICNGCGEER